MVGNNKESDGDSVRKIQPELTELMSLFGGLQIGESGKIQALHMLG